MSEPIAWLTCGNCGIDSNDETIDFFSTDCTCCHRDFCADCCVVINKEETNRCDECVGDCNTKCHQGMDCNCSDYYQSENEDEDEDDKEE